ncbi:MAG: lysophospholipid acyltransferase family protein [Bacteroidaceae bacterium]|nr:lysophospholipid acyltransferase family protein [Bacteroidaceae bacterium]
MKWTEWLLLSVLRGLSRLPLRVLYVLSDCLFPVVFYVVRYRRRLVQRQLADSLPEKTAEERRRIERQFYHNLCDYVVEILKLQTIPIAELKRRVRFVGFDTLQDEMHRRGKSVVFAYLGHFGNWEWLSSFALWLEDDMQAAQIYHPLRNKQADEFFLRLRARCGGANIPMKDTLRRILSLRASGRGLMVGCIADQSPKWEAMHHWTNFLHHETSFFIGAEHLAKRLDAVAFYLHVSRPRRGYYECRAEHVCFDTTAVPDYALTDQYAALLEQQIREEPALWLWTHDRWKRTREEWERRRKASDAKSRSEEKD